MILRYINLAHKILFPNNYSRLLLCPVCADVDRKDKPIVTSGYLCAGYIGGTNCRSGYTVCPYSVSVLSANNNNVLHGTRVGLLREPELRARVNITLGRSQSRGFLFFDKRGREIIVRKRIKYHCRSTARISDTVTPERSLVHG